MRSFVFLVLLMLVVGTNLFAQSGLPQGSAADLHGFASPESLAFTPQQGKWNAIGIGAMTTNPANVGVTVAGTTSVGSCGFVLADGNQGPITATGGSAFLPAGGTFQRVSALHSNVSAIAAGGGSALAFLSSVQYSPSGTQTGEFIHLWEVPISAGSEGVRNVRVSKAGNLASWKWAVFEPAAGTSWLPRSSSRYGEFTLSTTTGVDQQLDFNRAGRWCIAVYCEFTDAVDAGGTAVTVQVSSTLQGGPQSNDDDGADSSCSTGGGAGCPVLFGLALATAAFCLLRLTKHRFQTRLMTGCLVVLAASPLSASMQLMDTPRSPDQDYADFSVKRCHLSSSLFKPNFVTQTATDEESNVETKDEWPLQRDTLSAGIGPALGSDLNGVFGFISSHFAFIVQAPSFGAIGMAAQMGFGHEWGESSDGSTKFEHEVFSFTWSIGLAYHLRIEALPWTKTFTPYVAFYPVGGAYAAYKSSANLGGKKVEVTHDAYLYSIDSVIGADYHFTEHISLGTSFHLGGTIGSSQEKVRAGSITSTTTIEGRFTFFWEVVKFTWKF